MAIFGRGSTEGRILNRTAAILFHKGQRYSPEVPRGASPSAARSTPDNGEMDMTFKMTGADRRGPSSFKNPSTTTEDEDRKIGLVVTKFLRMRRWIRVGILGQEVGQNFKNLNETGAEALIA